MHGFLFLLLSLFFAIFSIFYLFISSLSFFPIHWRASQFKASHRKLNDDTWLPTQIHLPIKWRVKKMNSLNHIGYIVFCTKKGRYIRENAHHVQMWMSSFNQQFSNRWLDALLCSFVHLLFTELICILAEINENRTPTYIHTRPGTLVHQSHGFNAESGAD